MFKLIPTLKDYIWGGRKLEGLYGRNNGGSKISESWEVSVHPDGPSKLENGGTLAQYLADCPEAVSPKGGALPVLIKYIDAADNLSVQVHPGDEYARKYENDNGKTEMWYIVQADEGAGIYCGFREDTDKVLFKQKVSDGTVEELLNFIHVKAGDCFLIEAGTVHAIGAGLMVAEVQQSSNLTYRVYDYGRVGADGKPRELHIDKALAVARREPPKDPVGPTEPERAVAGGRIQPLFSCDKFTTETRTVEGEMADSVSPESFVSLLVLAGEGAIRHGGETYPVKKGQSVFLPAGLGDYALTGRMKLLRTRV